MCFIGRSVKGYKIWAVSARWKTITEKETREIERERERERERKGSEIVK